MKKTSCFSGLFALLLAFVSIAPFVYVLTLSFLPAGQRLTFRYYYDVFLGSSQYLVRFWKSMGICGAIVAGQLVVSVLAGYGFAKCEFPGKNTLLFVLMILMVLPLQVTLAPNYIMLDNLGLLDTYYALILPSIFVPLGAFILTQSFKSVSADIIDAAKLDGCGVFRMLTKVVLPMNTSGLVCVTLLSFLDGWNMVEQPIAYLKDFIRYPISVALAYVPPADPTLQLVCCILVVIPPLFLFTYFNKELVEGIVLAEVK
ncbi:carbohydrate ABC transporter permease [Acutalibacter sp. 1XD8-33]|uniref:carbohydrate ABC transporter permease n=1 Tax=Acutalibacter sp. 1XD8-33 TaxID=2320081 RepID=UPI000EA35F59|nr:carbohydrate ABC transporter permease [Acutalibacter sp. 1XD8-33]RKJ39219.1 carbohydrate ABC transporter permease [Acutalibacter sp. 1XD8-33]